MILLNRPPCPAELTPDLCHKLTERYKATKEAVWNLAFVKSSLLQMSNGKCCYCEIFVNEESKYMEVEHFYCKNLYPDDVMAWSNLLPSCKRCNTSKNEHDSLQTPIIDPSRNNPRSHLGLRAYRIKAKDQLGKNTVDVLDLNNTDRLVLPRFRIGECIQDELATLIELAEEYKSGVQTSIKRKNRIVGGIKNLLREAQPDAEYSAVTSSILLNDENYIRIREILFQLDLWDAELDRLEYHAGSISLEMI